MIDNGPPDNPQGDRKDHKFFERILDNDLDKLSSELQIRYDQILNGKMNNVTALTQDEIWKESSSASTMKWREYNVFQFHIPEIHKLYKAISDMTHEACDYYGIDFDEQNYMVQGWFNINERTTGKLGWHDHGNNGAPYFHGYYCVNAEPSVTHYLTFNKEVVNVNKNNRAILSEMSHPHAMGNWDWDGKRITIAYDVEPLGPLAEHALFQEQHWIPLV